MARVKKPTTRYCAWESDDDGNWHTRCGEIHILLEGGPIENQFRFCCYCGLKLKAKEAEPCD